MIEKGYSDIMSSLLRYMKSIEAMDINPLSVIILPPPMRRV